VSVHVIRRGHNRGAIVREEDDYRVLLQLMEAAAQDQDVSVHGYVVMTTHYHAIVTPHRPGSLEEMMKSIGEEYTRHYNRKYGRVGTLWAGRYRAIPLQDERQWFTCLRYVEQNPVRAGMVSRPEDYRWSSYHVHAGGEPSDWLSPHWLYLALGGTPAERQLAYRTICDVTLTEDELFSQRRPKRTDRARNLVDWCRLTGVRPGSDLGLTPK
jgi:putative transposase